MTSERIHVFNLRAVAAALLIPAIIEAVLLAAMFATMGHAGPEGSFAVLGWIGVLINLPGIWILSKLGLTPESSTLKLAATLFVVHLPLGSYLWFVIVRLFQRIPNRTS